MKKSYHEIKFLVCNFGEDVMQTSEPYLHGDLFAEDDFE